MSEPHSQNTTNVLDNFSREVLRQLRSYHERLTHAVSRAQLSTPFRGTNTTPEGNVPASFEIINRVERAIQDLFDGFPIDPEVLSMVDEYYTKYVRSYLVPPNATTPTEESTLPAQPEEEDIVEVNHAIMAETYPCYGLQSLSPHYHHLVKQLPRFATLPTSIQPAFNQFGVSGFFLPEIILLSNSLPITLPFLNRLICLDLFPEDVLSDPDELPDIPPFALELFPLSKPTNDDGEAIEAVITIQHNSSLQQASFSTLAELKTEFFPMFFYRWCREYRATERLETSTTNRLNVNIWLKNISTGFRFFILPQIDCSTQETIEYEREMIETNIIAPRSILLCLSLVGDGMPILQKIVSKFNSFEKLSRERRVLVVEVMNWRDHDDEGDTGIHEALLPILDEYDLMTFIPRDPNRKPVPLGDVSRMSRTGGQQQVLILVDLADSGEKLIFDAICLHSRYRSQHKLSLRSIRSVGCGMDAVRAKLRLIMETQEWFGVSQLHPHIEKLERELNEYLQKEFYRNKVTSPLQWMADLGESHDWIVDEEEEEEEGEEEGKGRDQDNKVIRMPSESLLKKFQIDPEFAQFIVDAANNQMTLDVENRLYDAEEKRLEEIADSIRESALVNRSVRVCLRGEHSNFEQIRHQFDETKALIESFEHDPDAMKRDYLASVRKETSSSFDFNEFLRSYFREEKVELLLNSMEEKSVQGQRELIENEKDRAHWLSCELELVNYQYQRSIPLTNTLLTSKDPVPPLANRRLVIVNPERKNEARTTTTTQEAESDKKQESPSEVVVPNVPTKKWVPEFDEELFGESGWGKKKRGMRGSGASGASKKKRGRGSKKRRGRGRNKKRRGRRRK